MALENFEAVFTKHLMIVKVGLAFTIIGIIVFLIIVVWLGRLRDWCSNCFEKKKDSN